MRRVTFQPRSSPRIKKTCCSPRQFASFLLFPLSPVSSNHPTTNNHHWRASRSSNPNSLPSLPFSSLPFYQMNQGSTRVHHPRSKIHRFDRDAILDLSADSYLPRRIITVPMIRVYDRGRFSWIIMRRERERERVCKIDIHAVAICGGDDKSAKLSRLSFEVTARLVALPDNLLETVSNNRCQPYY